MNSRERLCKVLNHEIPDRVPTFEYGISRNVIEAICPGGGYPDLVETIYLDAIIVWEPYLQRQAEGARGQEAEGRYWI